MLAHTAIQAEVQRLFERQGKALPILKKSSARERIAKLKKVLRFLSKKENEKALQEALHKDLRKSPTETISTELGPVLMSLRHLIRYLATWMESKRVSSPLSMAGTSSSILLEPKGRVLVISPWNYPFQLSINPTLHALAAGNAVFLKPSEVSPHISAFLKKMIGELFSEDEVCLLEGGVELAQELLAQPFDHIFFTGSPQIGKIVMAAAARNLSSVTLELGGKSPSIVDKNVNIKAVARKTAWAKTLNCGQTCIAPDYLIIHESLQKDFIRYYEEALAKLFNPKEKGIQQSPDYARIINQKHLNRLKNLIQDAETKGGKRVLGGEIDEKDLFIAPVLLSELHEEMNVLQEEIFGPVLPILTFQNIEEVPGILARRPKPLSFYIHSNNKKNIRFILENSSSGGAVINEYMLGSLNPYLPFGGVNSSGIGKSNGYHSFAEFSNQRGIVQRNWGTLRFLYPPYSERLSNLLRFIFKKV